MLASKEIVETIRKKYTIGCRVRLISMKDPYRSMPVGLEGTVVCIDDTGTIHVNWDNGSSLGVVYGEDSCTKI